MAKKAKRKVSSIDRGPVTPVAATSTTPAPSSVRSALNRRTMTAEEFNPDYSYVVKDLKRIGTLASIFFVVLVALSFIIR